MKTFSHMFVIGITFIIEAIFTLFSTIGGVCLLAFTTYVGLVLIGQHVEAYTLVDIQIMSIEDFGKDPNKLLAIGFILFYTASLCLKWLYQFRDRYDDNFNDNIDPPIFSNL